MVNTERFWKKGLGPKWPLYVAAILVITTLFTFQNCAKPFSAIHQKAVASTCAIATDPFKGKKVADEIFHAQDNVLPNATLVKDTPLLAIFDNVCKSSSPTPTPVGNWIEASEIAFTDLRFQAYALELDRDYSAEEFRQVVEADSCVLAIRLNRAITFNALPTDPLVARQQADFNSMEASAAYADLFPGITEHAVVAVIDSGIRYYDPSMRSELDKHFIEIYDTHPDLENVLWADDDGVVGYNFGTIFEPFRSYPIDTGNPYRSATTAQYERTYHGTHVAGIIAASTNNGIGIAGIAHGAAKIMPVRVTVDKEFKAVGYDTGSATTLSVLYNGVQYAVEPEGKSTGRIADVINISMGSAPISNALKFNGIDAVMRSALELAVSKGASVAVAAGNSSVDLGSNFVQPASLAESIEGVVNVGSYDSATSERSSFSNYGVTAVEISAPGSNILSAINEAEDDPRKPNDPGNTIGYGILSGTSMAAPQVAGAMAIAVAYHRTHGIPYTPKDIEDLIVNSALRKETLVAPGNKDAAKNRGLLNLKQLAQALRAKGPAAGVAVAPKLNEVNLLQSEMRKTSLFECP